MRKIILTLLTLLLVSVFAGTALAKDIKVTVNGQEVAFPDQKPFIEDGRTLVPIIKHNS